MKAPLRRTPPKVEKAEDPPAEDAARSEAYRTIANEILKYLLRSATSVNKYIIEGLNKFVTYLESFEVTRRIDGVIVKRPVVDPKVEYEIKRYLKNTLLNIEQLNIAFGEVSKPALTRRK